MIYEQLLTEKKSGLQRIAKTFDIPAKEFKSKDELVTAILTKQAQLIRQRRDEGRISLKEEEVVPLLPVQVNVDSLQKFGELAKLMRDELNELSGDALLEVASRLGYDVEKRGSYAFIEKTPVSTTDAAVTLLILLQLGMVPS
jgi:hypothetical protein